MKEPIKIDEEELEKIADASRRMGTLVFLKKGAINTSHIVSIIPDGQRIGEWLNQCDYGAGRGEQYQAEGIKPLRHMYGECSQIGVIIEARAKELESQQAPQLAGE